jgi:hypothetical protein
MVDVTNQCIFNSNATLTMMNFTMSSRRWSWCSLSTLLDSSLWKAHTLCLQEAFKYKLERNFIECFMISFWFIKVFLCLLQMKARNGWFGTSTNWEFHDPFTMRIWNTARLYIPCQNLASTKSLFNSSFSSIYKNYLSQNFKSFQPNQKLSFWLHLGFEVFRCTKLAITNWSGDKGWISESRYTERNTDGSTGTEDFQDFWTRVKYGPCDHKIFKSCGVVLGVEELENQMNMQRDY